MHETSYAKMGAFVAHYLADHTGDSLSIVDIGARSVLGHQTYRDLFNRAAWRFQGLDIEAGNNVDILVNDPYHWIDIEPASFDVAISGQALEHVEFPWKTFAEIFRVLKPGGLFCLIVPSSGEEHRYPVDCWRYYPDSMRALARDSGFTAVEVFTDFGLGNWQDTFAVFQKPLAPGENSPPFAIMEDRGAAFSEFSKALAARPRNPAYYLKLGGLLRERGRGDDADFAHRVGAELFPNHAPLKQEVVRALLASGEVVAAAEHGVALLGLRPIQPASVEAFGAVFEKLSAGQRAYYSKLLPIELPPLKRVANLAHESKHYQLAAACWEALAVLEPGDETHPAKKCLALWGTGEQAVAQAAFLGLRDKELNAGATTRTTVVQRLINATGAKLYLEIGVEQGINFLQIEAGAKFAVDPEFKIPGGTRDFDRHRFFETTSDAFFASPPPEIVEHGIDIALVDGLHTYEQALRDVENCLRYLAPGGLIVMHDCLPASAVEAAPSLEAARAMPGFKNAWTGDVYKAVVHLRAFRPDLFVAVLDCDHGIGLVQKGNPDSVLAVDVDKVRSLSYPELRGAVGHWLNLKPAEWFDNGCELLAKEMSSATSLGRE
jgi:SAM-dependent methyltransferase